MSGLKVVVAGAGALGSAIALRLQAGGAAVILLDAAATGRNASGVAAGMLAPAFEAVLDPASEGHFELYRAARQRWAAPPAGLAARLDRSGALWIGEEASLEQMLSRLKAVGAEAQRLGRAAAEAMSPGLVAPHGAVLAPEDWRLDPVPALTVLGDAFAAAGGRRLHGALAAVETGVAVLTDGRRIAAEHVVLATGRAPDALAEVVPEARLLSPIKGQIARVQARRPASGPTLRAEGVYIAPSSDGPRVGATMEPGLADLQIAHEALDELMGRAAGIMPDLAGAPVWGMAGVRAATPDGLPLVGPSRQPGLLLALGARRNGWLLALEVAEAAADWLEGRPGPPPFDPARFRP